jgi:hypothetical protein
MAGLDQILRSTAQYIATQYQDGYWVDIIMCGGRTNKDHPRLSEAGTNGAKLQQLLWEMGITDFGLFLEEESRNTPGNILGAYRLVVKHGLNRYRMVFICDSYRRLKVAVMARYPIAKVFGPPFYGTYEVVSFPRRDIHTQFAWIKQTMAAVLYWVWPKRFWDEAKIHT